MGQYYRPILTNANGYERVYNRDVDGEYTMAKLMEHSWWYNEFVGTICNKLLGNQMKVVWVGDYSDGADTTNEIESEELARLCKKAWKNKGNGVTKNVLLLDGLYLVNHTKHCYIDCNEYRKECDNKGWCIHPLPLLTAIGNGLGGGDYREDDAWQVGQWANDIISVENAVPDGYAKDTYRFREEW